MPFRTKRRAGDRGVDPVGTLYVDATVTGDSGGGTATIDISMSKEEFGFHAIWVPTIIALSDVLASAVDVRFIWRSNGNERLSSSLQELVTMSTVQSIQFGAATVAKGLIVDPDQVGGDLVFSATWATNTDAFAYHLHVYGLVWDGQVMAARGQVPELMAGLT